MRFLKAIGAALLAASFATSAMAGGTGVIPFASPSFKVRLASAQSVTSGATTKVAFDTVMSNVGGYWNTTNKNFNPQVAGTYLACVNIGTIATTFTSADNVQVWIAKNGLHGTGTDEWRGDVVTTSGVVNGTSVGGCTLVSLNGSTDTIEVDVAITATGPQVAASTAPVSTFSAVRVGP